MILIIFYQADHAGDHAGDHGYDHAEDNAGELLAYSGGRLLRR